MIQCPNCGGGLKFDIQSQQLKCESCSGQFDPYSVNYGNGAEESMEYDVTIFKCPQCGGEIVSTDETAAAFCSYCGASNFLESRISKEKKPQLIIPFKKTKKDCIDAYSGYMKRAIFAPNVYRSIGNAESFRGIYMPYWLYDMSQNGRVNFKTSSSHRRGDYIITDHYRININIDNYYNGVSYDASSSFADDISNEIAPFNVKDITKFSPSFLAGFYGDIADVTQNTYMDPAKELAREATYNYLMHKTPVGGAHVEDSKADIKNRLITQINVIRSAMFPVWFMSYRHKDRIAYATINGQTGRVSADLPVSVPKYFVLSAILSVIFFAILQMFFTLTPDVLMVTISIIALISVICYNSEMGQIVAKENYEDDRGMKARMERKRQERLKAQKGANFNQTANSGQGTYTVTDNDKNKNKDKKKNNTLVLSFIIGISLVALFFLLPEIMGIISNGIGSISIDKVCGFIAFIVLLVSIGLTTSSTKKIKSMKAPKRFSTTIFTCVAMGLVMIVSFWDPPQDIIYYAIAVISMICMVFNIIDMMASYNYIAMRPLPQFEMYHGGDDGAK
ncbi:MAG: hypothetical protein K6E10_04805 [Eubacterium sp.]|nr:hypothetical protein [Eubacterium sp.]